MTSSRQVVGYVQVPATTCYDIPISVEPTSTIGEALSLIHKRAHGAVMVVDATPWWDLHRGGTPSARTASRRSAT